MLAQLLFAAKQVPAAGDIQKQTFRGIEHDHRREALTPRRNIIEGAVIFLRIGLDRFQRWLHRARIGERHGKAQAQRACAGVHAC